MRAVGCLSVALAAGALLASGGDAASDPARQLFGAQRVPSAEPAQPFGTYARGCLAGGVALPETGPGWQVMRLDRNRYWGHPAMIELIDRLSRAARQIGWPRLYVGDISQPRGGPMNGGHASHQIGLDADIWLRIPDAAELSRSERQALSSDVLVRPDRMAVNDRWRPEHHALIEAAAKDGAVARIFVNPAIKKALCDAAVGGDRDWLRKVRAWWGHDSHFHVRLSCPPGAPDCSDQEPPPAGDGCGADLAWWFTEEARRGPSDAGAARRELTLDDLPPACRGLVLR